MTPTDRTGRNTAKGCASVVQDAPFRRARAKTPAMKDRSARRSSRRAHGDVAPDAHARVPVPERMPEHHVERQPQLDAERAHVVLNNSRGAQQFEVQAISGSRHGCGCDLIGAPSWFLALQGLDQSG